MYFFRSYLVCKDGSCKWVEASGDDEMCVIKKEPWGLARALFVCFVFTVFVFGICCLQFRSRRHFFVFTPGFYTAA
jgi:hypothetical protein